MPKQTPSSILHLLSSIFVCCAPLACRSPEMHQHPDERDGFIDLFNGRELTGWDGDPRFWSVEDGAITGRTTPDDKADANTFLIWRGGEVGDFDLRLKVRIRGNNSGVQYRSRDKGNWVVHGYQCDIGPGGPRHYGKLSEEKGRRWLAQAGQKVVIDESGTITVVGSVGDADAIEKGVPPWQWVDVRILARGNHFIHEVNGMMTVDVIDNHPTAASRRGILALQIHSGEPMEVKYKDIRLRRPGADDAGPEGSP